MKRLAWLVASAALLVACGDGGGAATSLTATTSSAVVVTTTTLPPALVAGAIADWGGQQVHTVCLIAGQTYPQVPGYSFDFAELATELLAPAGVTVAAAGQPCDAELWLSAWLEGRAGEYVDLGTVYSGMLRRLDLVLVGSQGPSVEFHHLTDTPANELASSLEPRTAEEFVAHYEDVWATILVEGLVRFWGPVVAVELVRSDKYAITAHAELCEIAGFGPGECSPSGYVDWRDWYLAHT